jgi:hypothetical protein
MPSTENRLDSWKEIAQYLGKYERTVQRWELERHLPVHRPPGTKRGGVFAYTDELDAWLAQTEALEESESEDRVVVEVTEEPRPLPPPQPAEIPASVPPAKAPFWSQPRHHYGAAAMAIFFLASLALAYYLGGHRLSGGAYAKTPFQVQQLSFRYGVIQSARFHPLGANIIYGATWEDAEGEELYEVSQNRPESFSLHKSKELLLSVSRTSNLAVLLNSQDFGPFLRTGTLAIQGLYEEKPYLLSSNVGWADWSADGSTLYYTVFKHDGISWIEAYSKDTQQTRRIYPTTTVRDQWYSHVRVSPRGDWIAFEQHIGMGQGGQAVLLNLSNGSTQVSRPCGSIAGMAWQPNGKEVWFTASDRGLLRGIYALTPGGKERLVYQAPVALTLQDIASNGDVLVTRDSTNSSVYAKKSGNGSSEVNLSLFDLSSLGDISNDGNNIALLESGDAMRQPSVYLRDLNGGAATYMGEATGPVSFSPNGNSLLALSNEPCSRAVLLAPGQGPQNLTRANLCVNHAIWMPDGHHMIFDAIERGHKIRCYEQGIGEPAEHLLAQENSRCSLISPNGQYVLVQLGDQYAKMALNGSHALSPIKLPLATSPVRPIRWLSENTIIADDGTSLAYVTIDLTTGRMSTTSYPMPAHLKSISSIRVSADLKALSYSGYELRSDLFLIRGLR